MMHTSNHARSMRSYANADIQSNMFMSACVLSFFLESNIKLFCLQSIFPFCSNTTLSYLPLILVQIDMYKLCRPRSDTTDERLHCLPLVQQC